MDFSQRFNHLLESRSITAYKFARDLGLSDGMIGHWRRGERLPTLESAARVADYFSVSLDYLAGRTDNPEVNKEVYKMDNIIERMRNSTIIAPEEADRISKIMAHQNALHYNASEVMAGSDAEVVCDYLYEIIHEFEESINQEEEVALRLASFGTTVTLPITEIAPIGKALVSFMGMLNGKPATLIQAVSQLNFLLCSQPRDPALPKKMIGFRSQADADTKE